MSEASTRRGGFTKRVRRLMDHYELAERLATITGRVDEAALRRAQPLGADIIAAFDAQAARIAELEAMLRQLEWPIRARYTDGDYCLMCNQESSWGHTVDCPLAALLLKEATDDTES